MTDVAGKKTSFARRAASNFHEWLPGYLFVLPATIFLFALTVYPSLHLMGLSLTDWKLTNVPNFVGIDNFTSFVKQPSSGRILYVTVLFLVLDLAVVLAIGLPVALALNGKLRFRSFIRAVALVPWAISAVVAGVVWRWMLMPETGVITYLLGQVGIVAEFLLHPVLALVSIVMVDAWRQVGYAAIFLLAGLQSIDPSLYEAASVDGANRWTVFRRITLPLLAPSLLVLLILLTIHALNTVDVILVVTGGGPVRLTETLAFHMYKEALYYFNIGYGSAVAVILLVINLALAVIYFRVLPGGSRSAT